MNSDDARCLGVDDHASNLLFHLSSRQNSVSKCATWKKWKNREAFEMPRLIQSIASARGTRKSKFYGY